MNSPLETRTRQADASGRRWSVRTFLVWLVLACLLPGIIGAALLIIHEYRAGHKRQGQDLILTARALVQTVDSYLIKVQVMGQTLATDESLARGDLEGFRQRAREVLDQTRVGSNVILLDGNTRQLVNLLEEPGQPLPQSPALATIRRVFLEGKPAISDIVMTPTDKGPIMSVFVPVMLQGRVAYVLSIGVMPETFDAILRAQNLPAEWITAIFDSTGTIAARTQAADRLVGQKGSESLIHRIMMSREGFIESVTKEGILAYSAYSRSPDTEWSVGIGIPRHLMQGELIHTLGILALGVGCLFAIGLALAWLAGERIAHSFRALTGPAQALGEGKATAMPALPIREAEEVMRAMSQAATLIAERTASLRRSKEHLGKVLDAARMVTFKYDCITGKVTRKGQTVQSLGLEPEGPAGDFFGRIHPEDRATLLSILEGLTAENPDYHFDYRFRIADGSFRWLSDHAQGIFNPDGRLAGVQGVFMDITPEKESELSLARERELFSAIIDNIPVMLGVYGPKSRRFHLNRYLEQVLGWTTEVANRGNFLAKVYPDPEYRAAAVEYMEKPTPGWREFDCTAKDGSVIPCEWANVALSDGSFIGIGIDLRERQASQADLARQAERQALLHDVALGILQVWGGKEELAVAVFEKIRSHFDADICLNYRLPAGGDRLELVAAFGIPAGLRDSFLSMAVGQNFCGMVAASGESLVLGQEHLASLSLSAAVRQLGLSACMVHPLFSLDGQVIGTLMLGSTHRKNYEPEEADILQTITYFLSLAWERRRAELEITRLNADLEYRVKERTAELTAANKELEGFTFATSHDLRGPLGRINSFSTLLEKEYRDRLEGNGLLFLDFIRQNSTRLMHLVDDLLRHARIAQQAPELQPVNVSALAHAVVQENAEEIREAGAEVRLDLPSLEILGDPQSLSQALGNLLQNALKYSADARPPAIEIGGEERETGFRLWVRDNGIGFDMAYHDKIFEIFRRLHTYNEYEGTGVGLALVKRAMERMGGRVWAESEPCKGATFYLEMRTAASPVH